MSDAADEELAERARKLFAGPIAFLKSAPELQFLPDPDVPEIAFAGRSNVGKSSLLNAITNRKGLARTSNTPGRTQELNFFDVGEPLQLRLVDMPGYGFAEAPKDMVKRWRFLVNDYLRGRAVLKRALVLVDSRHGLKDVDREMMQHARRCRGQLSAGPDQRRQGQADRACRKSWKRSPPRPPSIPPRIPPSSPRRAKRVAASPSCGPRSSKPRRPRENELVQADHRQPRLFELVDARLARAASSRARSSRSSSCRCSTTNGRSAAKATSSRRRCGKVPILWDGDIVVWDSLAIIDFLADRSARCSTGPKTKARAAWRGRWRRKCTRGFANLRRELPMNVRKSFPPKKLSERRARGDRPHPAAVGAGPRPVRRDRRVPVRRLVRGGHDVRAGGHALHHLRGAGAELRRACT